MTRRKSRQTQPHRNKFRARCEPLERRIALSVIAVVNSNADSGQGTLRQAILESHEIPNLTIDFAIKGPSLTIDLQSPLPEINSTVTIDGTSESGYGGSPLITVSGAMIGTGGIGFDFGRGSDGSLIEGLAVTAFSGSAIRIVGASNVSIGGPAAGQGNVISGNSGHGIDLLAFPVQAGGIPMPPFGIVVQGNEIGTDATGTNPAANGIGIVIQGGVNCTIGGTTTTARNIISGNTGDGIDIAGTTSAPNTTGNVIEGNFIGTNTAGTAAIANGADGIEIDAGASNNTVGGSAPGQMNLISGNTAAGVAVGNALTSANTIAGNQIGTDLSGGSALANDVGIQIDSGAMNNLIGGVSTGAGNLISGNTTAGILLSDTGTSDNEVAGNLIGTDRSGQNAIANGIGILVTGGSATAIGGTTAGAGNVISGNITAGIEIGGAASATSITGNKIGTNFAGTAVVRQPGETDPLVALQSAGIVIIGSQNNLVGGTSPQAQNLISGNYVGVMLATITGSGSTNLVMGNLIGTDATGRKSVPNIVGVYINGSAGSQVGGTTAGAGNVISGNSSVGVEIYGSTSTANFIEGNIIGLAEDGRSALLGTDGSFVQSVGVFIQAASGNLIGGSVSGAGNVISGNASAGVFILSRGGVSRANAIEGNLIGLAEDGSAGPGNAGYGILLQNAPNNSIGRQGPGANQFGNNTFGNTRIYFAQATNSSAAVSVHRIARRRDKHTFRRAVHQP